MDGINKPDKRDVPPANKNSDTHTKEDINTINSLKSEAYNETVAHYTVDPSLSVERVKFEGFNNEDSIDSDDDAEPKLPPIPDGGWGWVVVAAAFTTAACADGLAFSFGLLQKRFTDYFHSTQSWTSLIGAFFMASPLLAGPIMSALVDRYGCRIMTMLAGIVSTVGFLLAAVSDSIAMLCLTYGIISGLAMGILYVTSVVSVAFWFDKRRNFAVSLASCGIGFGTLIYSPMTQYFLEVYAWRSTIILLAGTLLNMCVCGALMRTPEWLEIKQKRERKLSKARFRKSSSVCSLSSRSLGGESAYLDPDELKAILESGKSPEYILAKLASNIEEAEKLEATTQANAENTYKRMHSAIDLPTFIQQNEKVPAEVIENLMENKRLFNIILQNYPQLLTRRKSEVNFSVTAPPADVVVEPAQLPIEIKAKKPKTTSESDKHKESGDKNEAKKSNQEINGDQKAKTEDPPKASNWLRQVSTTDYHYLKDMPLHKNKIMYRGAMLSIGRYRLRASSLPDMYKNLWAVELESDDEWRWYERAWVALKNTFDLKMFTEFHFLMFNISCVIMSTWFVMPFVFLDSYMSEIKVEGSEMIIAYIGIASSIGIIVLGWAGDQPWINVTKTYTACLIICGLSLAAYPLVHDYWGLAAISVIFGLSFASTYSYIPAILIELMPIEKFTQAYGLILLSQGIGHLVGPSIGGMLYDLTQSWDLTFYMAGLWLVVSGLCVGVVACTRDRRLCGSDTLLKEAAAQRTAADLGTDV